MRSEVFIGVDIGTQGVRAVAVDDIGSVVANARESFPAISSEEQSPESWWSAVIAALRSIGSTLSWANELTPVALSVTSTSGTIIPLDAEFRPLHNALMYADKRSSAQAARIEQRAPDLGANTSWGLPKIVWFQAEFPDIAERIAAWRHAADFVLGRITGRWDVTDITSALKSGYDTVADRWPATLLAELGVDSRRLPRVVASGTVLGTILPEIAETTGLPVSVLVTTGMTDGCASQVATGAVRLGDWNTTIGTTLVVKGVTTRRLSDPLSGIYSHRHPDGGWMPGGASNTGAEWVARDYAGRDLKWLEGVAATRVPTGEIAYPLRQSGERFPFRSAIARGFDPDGIDDAALYAARMEGTAYLERMAFERLDLLAGELVRAIFAAGGGSRSDLWLRIRANVLGRPIYRASNGEAALGAAVIAAAGSRFGSLQAAAAALTSTESTIEPDRLVPAYDDGYRRFVEELTRRGYLTPEERHG